MTKYLKMFVVQKALMTSWKFNSMHSYLNVWYMGNGEHVQAFVRWRETTHCSKECVSRKSFGDDIEELVIKG